MELLALALLGLSSSLTLLAIGIHRLWRGRRGVVAELPPSRTPTLDHYDPERLRRARSLT